MMLIDDDGCSQVPHDTTTIPNLHAPNGSPPRHATTT